MHFEDTKTYKNLARSFAGECQAGMRYQFIAEQAKTEGYKTLSDIIKSLAKNETVHAKIFFDEIVKNGAYANIDISAGYPFRSGNLEENLNFAREDENKENTTIYPDFQKTALDEGFVHISNIFKKIAEVEAQHESMFKYLFTSFKDGTLYKDPSPKLWVCSECGHMATMNDAWHICPLCGKSQGFVKLHLPYEQTDYNVAQRK